MNLAPNGKPSNLTPEQYKLVRTPEFKEWFGDWENNPEGASKVVDENGEPLVLNHSTRKNQKEDGSYEDYFDVDSWLQESGNYLFSTPNSSVNPIFLSRKGEYALSDDIWQIKFFANIKNLFDTDNKNHLKKLQEYTIKTYSKYGDYNEMVEDLYGGGYETFEVDYKIGEKRNKWENSGSIPALINEMGYDAYINNDENVIVVFDRNKLKLADGTNTTFDSENPDIRFDGGGLIAPNGKPSNLTPEQYKLVRTKAFKDWFGDWENNPEGASKVVDENGEPLVVYHGAEILNKIEKGRFNLFNKGSYFTDTYESAKYYAFKLAYGIDDVKEEDTEIYEVFLNIKNPKTFDYQNEDAEDYFHDFYEEDKRIKNYSDEGYDGLFWEYSFKMYNTTIKEKEKHFITFQPTQIKLADGSNTTFDSENPDIRFDGGGLIAPNGKPSNLTPEQYKLVRTPEFKSWFGDWENNPEGASKVIDENGEPKVSYHGSSGFYDGTMKGWGTKFTKFSTNRLIFATNNYKVAEHFGEVGEYFVNIKNPFILNENSHSWERLNENELIEKLGEFDFIQFVNEYFNEEFSDIDEYWQSEYDSEPTMIDIDSFGEYLKKNFNYDGIIAYGIEETPAHIEADDYISFEPNQIKLADGTNTTFDSENPDIRFDGGGNVPDEFWGNQAGGVLIICSRTNKVLLLKRSPYVQEPETWGMISGKIDAGETIEEAVAREVKEETGWKIDNLIPSYVFKKNDFTFYNFISVVDIEFTPTLNWENTDYGWFDLSNLPENLHFGVDILLLKDKYLKGLRYASVEKGLSNLKGQGLNINDKEYQSLVKLRAELEQNRNKHFKEGGYVKSKKVYVSIKLPYNFEKENEKDIMKSFIRYEDKPFQELQEHKLVGVIGVSKSRLNIADWLIFRDCLIVMNYDEFMQLNDATEIEYDNPEQLMANDLEIFNRLYDNKREENQDEWYTKFHRRNNLSKILERLPFEFKIAGKKEKDQKLKSELYRIENFTNQYETGKFMNWLEKNNYIINSPQEFVDLIIKYHYSDESKSELSSFYGNTDNLKITSEYIYPIVYKALIKAGSTYIDEEEIILNNRVLNIPNDSQLFFVKKDKSNQDELIEKYQLKDTYRVEFVKQENIDRFRSQIDKKRTENWEKNRELNIQKLQEKANEVLPILLQEIKDNISEYYYSKAKKLFDKEYYKEYEGDDTKYYKVEDIPEVQLYLNNALEIVDYLFKERFYYAKVNDINKYYFSNFNYAIKDLLIKYINDHSEFAWEIDKYHDEYNNSVYSSDFAWTLREIFDYDEPVKELSANNIKNRYIELMDADMFRYYPEKDLNLYKGGGRTIAQTPAPKKERIYGSDKNPEGSSKDVKSAKSIELSEKTIQSIKNKIDEHNKTYPKKKVSLASAKAVVRRGMGAYSVSHRPTITGGKPNSRVAWGLARLNAFLYKIINGKSKSGKYNQDDDLINELGYKVKNYETGGNMEKTELQKGIEVEMEHSDTIRKLMSGNYTIEQGAEMIAKDHLKENDKYYTHLLEMESKFYDGGSTYTGVVGVVDCIEYIKNSEPIKNNGYYLHFDNLNNYVGENSVNVPKINSLCMITFNSGDSTMLALEISKLLNIDIEIARIIVYEQTTYSKPFTMDVLKDIENKNIIVADSDKIVCTNLSKNYNEGGYVIDEDIVSNNIQTPVVGMAVINKDAGQFDSVEYVLDVFDDGNGVRVGDEGANSGIGIADFRRKYRPATQEEVNRSKVMSKSLVELLFKNGGQTPAQQEKIAKVMGEFKRGELNTSYGTKVTDEKQAIAIALSEAGLSKKEEGGVIEGQLHSECNDESGCGEKFDVGGVGNVIEAERDEAVIVSNAFKDQSIYTIKGTPSQVASALNVLGGGKNFDGGAIIIMSNGKQINTDKIKSETKDVDVKDDIEAGSVIINRRSMYDNTIYEVKGTPKQIASAINSINGFGVVIEDGATIKEA